MKMVDFTDKDKVLYLKGLEDEMQRCEKLDNNELYTFILDTIRQIDEQKDKLDDLYIQYTALNNILSLRLWKGMSNEFGCIGCVHILEDDENGDLECGNPYAKKGGEGVPQMVCSEPHMCPYYEDENEVGEDQNP